VHEPASFAEPKPDSATPLPVALPRELEENAEGEKEQPKPVKHTLKTVSNDAEYEMIVAALKKANFNKSKAAKLLNVDRKTLYNKMKLHSEYNAQ
jgi:two-component system response regulator HydG